MHGEASVRTAKQKGVTSAPVLLSISEFAARMGISVSTARRLCYARGVTSVKFNRSLLVPATEVQRLIEAHLRQALPVAAPVLREDDARD